MVPVLFTFCIQGVLKFKKNNSGAKRLSEVRIHVHIKEQAQLKSCLMFYKVKTKTNFWKLRTVKFAACRLASSKLAHSKNDKSIKLRRKGNIFHVTLPLTYLLTYLLTPWCRVLLEKLTGLQLVKKFPAFHGTRRFITALTTVRHLSLSWASPIQSITHIPPPGDPS